MRKFFLQTKTEDGVAPLYTRVRKKYPNTDMWINTHILVDVAKWNKCYCDISLYSKTTGTPSTSGGDAETLAQEVAAAIKSATTGEFTRESVQEAVDAVVFAEARELLRAQQEEERRQREELEAIARAAKAKADANVRTYLANLIQDMKDGQILIEGKGRNKGQRYTKGSLKMWCNFKKILNRYYKQHPFTWDEIDKRFAVRFTNWMRNEGYMASTVNKYVSIFQALITRAYLEGKHTNRKAPDYFVKTAVDDTQKSAEIYLTADELNALYNMSLTGEKAVVRDVFVVGCCTCQRVSDYGTLKRENFTTTARGTKVVKLQQVKTKKVVTIPILDDKLVQIAQKYNYNIPRVSDVILNRYIKEICQELAQTVPSLNKELPTVLTMKERAKEQKALENGEKSPYKRDEAGRAVKPRYELVTTHTARRTGITNLYLTGKFDVYQMMHISGHTEAKTFREYIKLSDEEIAEGIAAKMANDNLF